MGISVGVLNAACCGCPARETVLPCHSTAYDETESVVEGELKWNEAGFSSAALTQPPEVLLDLRLNPFERGRTELCGLYLQMIQVLGLQDRFGIPGSTVVRYADEVSLSYRDVRYHNFSHAFSVTQFLFTLVRTSKGIAGQLAQEDVLAMLVAAIVHDGDHPGNNNAWEVATKSALAIQYNSEAVLENHHAAVGLRIMRMDRHNMLGTLGAESQEEVRRSYLHAILQTDMAKHSAMVEDLNSRVAKGEAFNRDSPEERRTLVGVLLHSADISNPLLPKFDLCKNWAERIKDEFWAQYKQELEREMTPTSMWANLGTRVGFYKSQVGFIDFVVSPLWSTVFNAFPDLHVQGGLPDTLGKNRTQWAEELKQVEDAAQKVQDSS